MCEEWRPVAGYEGLYEVSDLGRVKSLRFRTKIVNVLRSSPLILKPLLVGITTCCYWRVDLSDNGKKAFYVHRLVLEAFSGPCPKGHQCGHLNGNPQDNRHENLKWITPGENQLMRFQHGTSIAGERNPKAKLTWEQVDDIRRRVSDGETQASVAGDYGIRDTAVSRIVRRKSWKRRPPEKTNQEGGLE